MNTYDPMVVKVLEGLGIGIRMPEFAHASLCKGEVSVYIFNT